MSEIHILGAGGHAKVVIQICRAAGLNPVAVFDDNVNLKGQTLLGVPIEGPICAAVENPRPTIIAIGDNRRRKNLSETLGLPWMTAIHPSAVIDPTVCIGEGTVVSAGAILQVDTTIGQHAIINTAATIDHDGKVGDFAHVAPGCHVSGGVSIANGALIGVGSSICPGVSVGEWTTVGAGSAVIKNLSQNVVYFGVPARPL